MADGLDDLAQQLYCGNSQVDVSSAGNANLHEQPLSENQAAEAPVAPMSKNQQKKLAKLERIKQKKAAAKLREKEERATRREQRLEERKAMLSSLSPEAVEALRVQEKAKLDNKNAAKQALKDKMIKSLDDGVRVVIDLDFEDYMVESDKRHLCQQLSYSYSANKAADVPLHMILTSFTGATKARTLNMVSGVENWTVTCTEQPYDVYFASEKGRVVYLSADAEHEIEDLEADKVYVIGGLVDHNKHKGLCEKRARERGVATARLPIQRHVTLGTSSVLTVNHVFQLLVEYVSNGRDWAAAVDRVVPQRKRADRKQGQVCKHDGALDTAAVSDVAAGISLKRKADFSPQADTV